MDSSVNRPFKMPAIVILASFIIVVTGMKAASPLLVPIFGMILSIPITSVVKIALESYEDTRRLAKGD